MANTGLCRRRMFKGGFRVRGLALEGGGARGAYHIGVVKALFENGYEFDGFVGTSIGAINAAILAQGDFEKALELWTEISMDKVFDMDDQQLLQFTDIKNIKLDVDLPENVRKALAKVVYSGGINTNKIKRMITQYIHEDQLRKSHKDFGLVTVSILELKPYELMIEDIPRNRLANYLMASASLPGLRRERFEGKSFLDGAYYDNCPYNLLRDRGYDEIIVVRTKAPGVFRKTDENKSIKVITASKGLGNILLFTPENSAANIALGYDDGLRFVAEMRGR